jgi:hypothetical protein
MRPILPAILAAAIVSETVAEEAHELTLSQPHVEPELRQAAPTVHVSSTSPGAGGGLEPLGNLRSRLLYRNSARARLSKDKFALPDAFVKTAHELMRLRAMKQFERQIQFDCFRVEIEFMSARTRGHHDFSNTLSAIAKILDVPYTGKPGVVASLLRA